MTQWGSAKAWITEMVFIQIISTITFRSYSLIFVNHISSLSDFWPFSSPTKSWRVRRLRRVASCLEAVGRLQGPGASAWQACTQVAWDLSNFQSIKNMTTTPNCDLWFFHTVERPWCFEFTSSLPIATLLPTSLVWVGLTSVCFS